MATSTVARTPEQIIEQARFVAKTDLFGFGLYVLLSYLNFDQAKEFLNDGAKPEEWEAPLSADRESVLAEMEDYMSFAWEKANGERGISASRSVAKFTQWMWMIGDDEGVRFASSDSNYYPYGKPILSWICKRYGFDDESEA